VGHSQEGLFCLYLAVWNGASAFGQRDWWDTARRGCSVCTWRYGTGPLLLDSGTGGTQPSMIDHRMPLLRRYIAHACGKRMNRLVAGPCMHSDPLMHTAVQHGAVCASRLLRMCTRGAATRPLHPQYRSTLHQCGRCCNTRCQACAGTQAGAAQQPARLAIYGGNTFKNCARIKSI
jgi:hypothetical protein